MKMLRSLAELADEQLKAGGTLCGTPSRVTNVGWKMHAALIVVPSTYESRFDQCELGAEVHASSTNKEDMSSHQFPIWQRRGEYIEGISDMDTEDVRYIVKPCQKYFCKRDQVKRKQTQCEEKFRIEMAQNDKSTKWRIVIFYCQLGMLWQSCANTGPSLQKVRCYKLKFAEFHRFFLLPSIKFKYPIWQSLVKSLGNHNGSLNNL